MPEFLLELYMSRHDAIDGRAERARRAAQELVREGVEVRYVQAIFVPEDETCFFLYEARAAEDVAVAARLAELPFERVTAAVSPASETVSRE